MDYGIVLQLIMGLVTVVSVFVIVKQKVQQHDETFKTMHQELKESFKKRDDEAKADYLKLDKKIDVCFQKHDEAKKELISFEKALDKKVTLKEVTEEFVTRKELELQLELIKNTTSNIEKEVNKVEEQVNKVLDILQELQQKNTRTV